MSTPSSNDIRSALNGAASLDRFDEAVLAPVRVAAFWTAIALPFLYIPMLATGLDSVTETVAFVALLFCNVVALLVGHPHYRE